ncbi:MAG: peptidoglycan DD-metalloendopeptidase family protein [Candidatus Woesearchaeota archaeon]
MSTKNEDVDSLKKEVERLKQDILSHDRQLNRYARIMQESTDSAMQKFFGDRVIKLTNQTADLTDKVKQLEELIGKIGGNDDNNEEEEEETDSKGKKKWKARGKKALRATGSALKNMWGALGKLKGPKNEVGRGNYSDKSNWVGALFFIFFFVVIVIYEMLGGGYFSSINPVRILYAVIFLVWGWLTLPEERQAVWMVFLWTLLLPILFSFFTGMSIISETVTGAAAYHTIALFAFPAIIYYMLFSEGVRLPWIFGIARLGLVVIIIMLTFSFVNAGEIIERVSLSGDTGFDISKALQGISGGFQGFSTGFLEPLVCALNPNCGFQNWLTQLTEPFAYDSTTVHDIQNKDLGIYVENLRVPREMDLTGMQFAYHPEPIGFYIRAPIPDRLGFELCHVPQDGLKGFHNICSNDILVECHVQDAGGTRIIPSVDMSIADAIASRGLLYQCYVQSPRLGSKRVNLSVTYPFVTNTYKLIRAVDADRVLTRQAQAEISRLPQNYIISTGGPVIIESDESEYIPVREDTTTNLLIRLKARQNVQLMSVENILIYLPQGMTLRQGQDSLCQFVSLTPSERTPQEIYDNCEEEAEQELNITDLDSECRSVATNRKNVPACRMLDACADLRDRELFLQNIEHENAYELRAPAREIINQILEGTAKQKTGNDITIGCEIDINKNEFLDENPLNEVTQAAINIVSWYHARHQVTDTIRFTGTFIPTTRAWSTNFGTQICNDRRTGLSVPIGALPLSDSPTLTHEFESTADPFSRTGSYSHTGIDLVSGAGSLVRTAWRGTVFKVEDSCEAGEFDCGNGYGNHVVIESIDEKGKTFYHIYAHLDRVSNVAGRTLDQGYVIGTQGDTGRTTGPHLHFEVRVGSYSRYTLMNPLPCIDHTGIEGDLYENAITRAMAGVTYTNPAWVSDIRIAQMIDEFIDRLSTEEQQNNASRIVSEAASQGLRDIEVALILAIADQESRLNHYRTDGRVQRSDSNATGLMQVIPSTARAECGLQGNDAQIMRSLEDINTNVRCGVMVYKNKPNRCVRLPLNENCMCELFSIGDESIPLSIYDNTIYGKVRAYVGWSCSRHQEYVPEVYDRLKRIVGAELTPPLPHPTIT